MREYSRRAVGWRSVITLAAALCLTARCAAAAEEDPDGHMTICWEAENYTAMLAPIEVQAFQGASGGQCVTTPDRVACVHGRVLYRVRVPHTGTYYPWFRLYTQHPWKGWGQLEVDGELAGPLVYASESGSWHWNALVPRHSVLPVTRTVRLTRGPHTLSLRSPGIGLDGMALVYGKLDMILLTTDPEYLPGGDGVSPVAPTKDVVLQQQEPQVLLVWEAEDLPPGRDGPLVSNAEGASGGKAVLRADGPGAAPAYGLRIPDAGQYYLWARVRCRTHPHQERRAKLRAHLGERDLTLTGGPAWAPEYWAWVRSYERPEGWPSVEERAEGVDLADAEAKVAITGQNPWTSVDQFALTTDADYVPGADGRQPLKPTPNALVR